MRVVSRMTGNPEVIHLDEKRLFVYVARQRWMDIHH